MKFKRTKPHKLLPLRNPRFLEASLGQKEKSECTVVRLSGCPVMTQRRPEPRLFLAEPPRRENLSHRPPHRIVDALSKFGLHRCLLRCVRECRGVGDVGPKFGTHLRVRGARGNFILLVLNQLSRKLDASRTTVKIC